LDDLRGFGAVTVELSENFRNPEKVATEAYSVIDHPPPVCRRQLDSPVEYLQVSGDKKAAAKLRALLVELIRDGISPSDIVLLSFRKNKDRLFDRFPPDIGKALLSPAEVVGAKDAISVGSISGFKGLESEVVIVIDVPDQLTDSWQRSLFLVALTRTRTKCFVLVSEEFLSYRTDDFVSKLTPELDIE
jgi:superfamily I DNA/RNA helicase